MTVTSPRRAAQSEATRRLFLRVARRSFATKGYTATSTEDVVRRARATRGALYHHFKTKTDLFQAVYEDVQADLARTIATAVDKETSPLRRLLAVIDTFLDECLDPAVQRIVLLDAPSALGWDLWREIDSRHGLALLTTELEHAMRDGSVETMDTESLAHLILGAVNEAAMAIARAHDVTQARRVYGASVLRVLNGLRPAAVQNATRTP